jgi:hypothetical protein
VQGPWAPGGDAGGNGNGHPPPPSAGSGVAANVKGKAAGMTTKEKVEQDCLKLIQAVQELKQAGEEQSLRSIAARAGMSKDEVNRYLNPIVRELYDYERLLHVRKRNRPLYNWLIVSGPPKVDEGKWAGIMANTSKYGLFQAVAMKYGWVAKHLGQRGAIIDLEYHGIEGLTEERVGKAFRRQEAVMGIDDHLPPAGPGPGTGS